MLFLAIIAARLKPNLGALRFWDGVEAERGKLPLYPAHRLPLAAQIVLACSGPPCEVRLGGPDWTPPLRAAFPPSSQAVPPYSDGHHTTAVYWGIHLIFWQGSGVQSHI